jgi:hypothetical protein
LGLPLTLLDHEIARGFRTLFTPYILDWKWTGYRLETEKLRMLHEMGARSNLRVNIPIGLLQHANIDVTVVSSENAIAPGPYRI